MPEPSSKGQTDYELEQWAHDRWVRLRSYRAEDDDHALDFAEDYLASRFGHHPGPFRILIVSDHFVMHRSGTAARTAGPRFNTS